MRGNPHGIIVSRTLPGNVRNPYWPLPANYPTMTPTGQRKARLNACLMQQTSTLAMEAWNFFCWWYLRPHDLGGLGGPDDGKGKHYDPMWYEGYSPPSKFHKWLVYWFEEYPLLVAIMPRKHAKSTTTFSYVLGKLCTNNQAAISVYLSKFRPFVTQWSEKLSFQLENNRRILNDFGDLRSKKAWGVEYRKLSNHSSVTFFSIDGNLRGPGPKFSVADDTDQDGDDGAVTTDPAKLAKTRTRFLSVLGPMNTDGASLALIGTTREGTLVDHAYNACEDGSDNNDESFRSIERGGIWKKFKVGAHMADGKQIWDKYTPDYYRRMKVLLGAALYSSEFDGNVIGEGHRFRLTGKDHEYRWSDRDGLETTEPFRSNAFVHWFQCDGVDPIVYTEKREKWSDWLRTLIRVVVVDPATAEGSTADYAVIHVMGMDEHGDLWSLDLHAEKGMKSARAVDVIFQMCDKWQASMIGIESVSFQEEWKLAANARVEKLAMSQDYVPTIVAVDPKGVNKVIRIASLAWRYDWGRIKYPGDRVYEPEYKMLWHQTLRFGTSMKNDDCIDTTEMGQRLFRLNKPMGREVVDDVSPIARMLRGDETDENGMNLGAHVPMNRVSPEVRQSILAVRRADRAREMAGTDEDPAGGFGCDDVVDDWEAVG